MDAKKVMKKDIIRVNGQYYLVLNEYHLDYQCILLSNFDEKNSKIDFSKELFDFHSIIFLKKGFYSYVNTISNMQYEVILKKYQNFLDHEKKLIEIRESKILMRGCIIYYRGNYFYVYGTQGNIANTFVIRPKKDNGIKIAGEAYEPAFDITLDMPFDKNYKVVGIASEQEMNFIREQKKSYLKEKQASLKKEKEERNQKAKNSRFCFGKVIASSYHFSTKFLVIGVDHQFIHAIALERFMTDAQIVHYEFLLGDTSLKTLSPKKQERNFILNYEEYFHSLFDNKVGNSRVLKKQEN